MNFFLAFGMPGMTELLVLLAVVILIFGAKKLPELARGMGRSIGEFKKGREESKGEEPDSDSAKPAEKTKSD